MFDHPNNSGFEIISYFLFVTLNEARATELFRYALNSSNLEVGFVNYLYNYTLFIFNK